MITLTPVLERWPAACPFWSVDQTEYFLAIPRKPTPRQVGTVVWALIGSVVGVDPVTAARRWRSLTDSGTAWIAAYPAADAGSVLAFLDTTVHGAEWSVPDALR